MSMLRILLIIIFLISALAVTIIVLLQEGKSAGLGSMGGSTGGESYWEKNKKHSLEGKFEKWTKITAVVFVLSAFLIMLIPNNTSTVQITDENGQLITQEETTGEAGEVATDEATTDETATNAETTDEAATDTATTDEAVTNEASTEASAEAPAATDSAPASN